MPYLLLKTNCYLFIYLFIYLFADNNNSVTTARMKFNNSNFTTVKFHFARINGIILNYPIFSERLTWLTI